MVVLLKLIMIVLRNIKMAEDILKCLIKILHPIKRLNVPAVGCIDVDER